METHLVFVVLKVKKLRLGECTMLTRLPYNLLSIFLTIVLLISCSNQAISPSQTPNSIQNNSNVPPQINQKPVTKYERWFQGIPCHLPCWENITVGSTTMTQAISILTNTKFLNLTLYNDNNISWEWLEDGSRGAIQFTDKTTSYIQISFRNPPVKLREIITLIGEPSHIKAYYTAYYNNELKNWDITYYINFIYQKQNIILKTLPNRFKPVLNQDIMITSLILVKLSDRLADPADTFSSNYTVLPWQGFNSFDFYCRTLETIQCQV